MADNDDDDYFKVDALLLSASKELLVNVAEALELEEDQFKGKTKKQL